MLSLHRSTAVLYYFPYNSVQPVPVAARSKEWVCGHSLPGITGSNTDGCMDDCLLWMLCSQLEVSATGRSLVQRNLTYCGVPQGHREASTVRRPWPTGGGDNSVHIVLSREGNVKHNNKWNFMYEKSFSLYLQKKTEKTENSINDKIISVTRYLLKFWRRNYLLFFNFSTFCT